MDMLPRDAGGSEAWFLGVIILQYLADGFVAIVLTLKKGFLGTIEGVVYEEIGFGPAFVVEAEGSAVES